MRAGGSRPRPGGIEGGGEGYGGRYGGRCGDGGGGAEGIVGIGDKTGN